MQYATFKEEITNFSRERLPRRWVVGGGGGIRFKRGVGFQPRWSVTKMNSHDRLMMVAFNTQGIIEIGEMKMSLIRTAG
eukprot:scaffold188830_cov68-Cyclotella_meneghiniana.AAC.1